MKQVKTIKKKNKYIKEQNTNKVEGIILIKLPS